LLFRGGAEPTAVPPFVSTRFVDSFFPARRFLSPARLFRLGGGGFYHHRVSSQLASSTSYFALSASAGGPHRQCGFAFPSVGARLLSPRPAESQLLFHPSRRSRSSLTVPSQVTSTSPPVNCQLPDTRPRGEGPYPPSDPPTQALSPNRCLRPSQRLLLKELAGSTSPRRGPQGMERSKRSLERSTLPCRQRSATTTEWRSA
jgi:hypothetical protein